MALPGSLGHDFRKKLEEQGIAAIIPADPATALYEQYDHSFDLDYNFDFEQAFAFEQVDNKQAVDELASQFFSTGLAYDSGTAESSDATKPTATPDAMSFDQQAEQLPVTSLASNFPEPTAEDFEQAEQLRITSLASNSPEPTAEDFEAEEFPITSLISNSPEPTAEDFEVALSAHQASVNAYRTSMTAYEASLSGFTAHQVPRSAHEVYLTSFYSHLSSLSTYEASLSEFTLDTRYAGSCSRASSSQPPNSLGGSCERMLSMEDNALYDLVAEEVEAVEVHDAAGEEEIPPHAAGTVRRNSVPRPGRGVPFHNRIPIPQATGTVPRNWLLPLEHSELSQGSLYHQEIQVDFPQFESGLVSMRCFVQGSLTLKQLVPYIMDQVFLNGWAPPPGAGAVFRTEGNENVPEDTLLDHDGQDGVRLTCYFMF